MLRWLTAGESHGPSLTAVVEGMPAGVHVTTADLQDALARRRLVMAIIGFILFGVLVYYAWRYGWPWLMAQWKPAQ